jgi:hypothetical protein
MLFPQAAVLGGHFMHKKQYPSVMMSTAYHQKLQNIKPGKKYRKDQNLPGSYLKSPWFHNYGNRSLLTLDHDFTGISCPYV